MRDESDYISEIESLAQNLDLTTNANFFGLKFTLPNITTITPVLKRVRRLKDECRIQGYEDAQRRAEAALERKPSFLETFVYKVHDKVITA